MKRRMREREIGSQIFYFGVCIGGGGGGKPNVLLTFRHSVKHDAI